MRKDRVPLLVDRWERVVVSLFVLAMAVVIGLFVTGVVLYYNSRDGSDAGKPAIVDKPVGTKQVPILPANPVSPVMMFSR